MIVPIASAQPGQPPQVGYVWPAGGQRGQSFEITVGGQRLSDKTELIVTGRGVQAEIVEYWRPATGKEIATVRLLQDQAEKQLKAELPDGKTPPRKEANALMVKLALEQGMTIDRLNAVRKFHSEKNDPKIQLNPQLSEVVRFKVTLADDAPPGTRELRVKTANGLSNPLRFQVGRLAELSETEPNDQADKATAVPQLPVVLNGQIKMGDVDHFSFEARKGQRIVADVNARRLIPYLADAVPGWFQAVVALHDEDGREVAYGDDFRFDPDPVLVFQVPHDGKYVLEIRDSIYRGREDFVYRVALGQLPFVSGIYPLGGQLGQQTQVAVAGWNLPDKQRNRTLSFDNTGRYPFKLPVGDDLAQRVTFDVSDLPQSDEHENNDEVARAEALTLPVVVNGRLAKPGDHDVFRIHATAGQIIVAEVIARRVGSPLDSRLRLTDAEGRTLADNDDHVDRGAGLVTHHADSLLSFEVPAEGDYLLWLSDVEDRGGRDFGYRLRVSEPRPDFELRVTPSAVNARNGATVPITVYVLRRDGFVGDVTLNLKDAPKGFQINGWLPSGVDSARLTLTVPAKPPQQLNTLQLEGIATINGHEVRRIAIPADNMMQAFIYEHLVPSESWTIDVESTRIAAVPWKFDAAEPLKLALGQDTDLRAVPAAKWLADQAQLELSDPPAGVSLQKTETIDHSLAMTLQADAAAAKSGLKGNLIFNVYLERQPPKDGDPKAATQNRRTLIGALPAIPFEIVGDQPAATGAEQSVVQQVE
ncbi:MAG: peptidase [Phycisphaeraceae bacterium]|nr:peptidase [Phycisphaeraceae bacterium]